MLRKEEILERTNNGLSVFKHYISGRGRIGRNFLNPLYEDNKASCNIYFDRRSGIYKMKDFGNDSYSGDCFFFVGRLKGLDCNNSMDFVEQSLIVTVVLADIVFCFFNFRQKGKAICFAGDVGAIGIAYILLFLIGNLVLATGDVTFLIFLLVYGVDGCLTIVHRILLHENLGEAHRKHVYQLMANELKIGHVKVSSFYALLQLVISLGFVYLCPDTVVAHWIYLISAIIVLALIYVLFKKKYYHLHEEYLASLKNGQ